MRATAAPELEAAADSVGRVPEDPPLVVGVPVVEEEGEEEELLLLEESTAKAEAFWLPQTTERHPN